MAAARLLTLLACRLLWKCWCMSMYWSMLSSAGLVCIVYLTSIVDLICVCWNVTYAEEITVVVLSRCRSLHLTLCDLSRPPWHPSHRLDSCILCGFCVCWPPKRRVYNITSSSLLHREYLLLLCCLLKVSQYRLALIDSLCPHCHNTSTD